MTVLFVPTENKIVFRGFTLRALRPPARPPSLLLCLPFSTDKSIVYLDCWKLTARVRCTRNLGRLDRNKLIRSNKKRLPTEFLSSGTSIEGAAFEPSLPTCESRVNARVILLD